MVDQRSRRRQIIQEAHDPNSLLHEGFRYAERGGNNVPSFSSGVGSLSVDGEVNERVGISRRKARACTGSLHIPASSGLSKDPVELPKSSVELSNPIAAGDSSSCPRLLSHVPSIYSLCSRIEERTGQADPLLPDDRGRRHLTMAGSKTEAFRPCRRVLTPGFSGAKHARAQGLARIEPSPRVTPRPTGLRTNAEASRRSGYDIPDPGLVLQSKHVTMDDTGRAAKERVSGELTLEKAVGLKRKVNSQREKRGGVPAKGNPGDKLFHHVDYSPGFHQHGELIVGSSFYRTMPRRGSGHTAPGLASLPAPVPEGVGYAIGYRRPNMAFHETRQASQYLEDLRGVLELTEAVPVPAVGGQEEGPSWEEKTGMHTWPRKQKITPVSESPPGAEDDMERTEQQ